MAFDYRHAPLPDVWPGKPTLNRVASPFGANWGATLELLGREIKAINGRDVVLCLSVLPGQIRQDGGVRADARVKSPAVILQFRRGAEVLSFPCDRFTFWQDNVRAIALALEALRKVDRYGVQQGRQYEGFKQLPASTAPTSSAKDAAIVLARHSGYEAADILGDQQNARAAFRVARSRTHPDTTSGSHDAWHAVEAAAQTLMSANGWKTL